MEQKMSGIQQSLESPTWLTDGSAEWLTPSDHARNDVKEISERYRSEIADKIAKAVARVGDLAINVSAFKA